MARPYLGENADPYEAIRWAVNPGNLALHPWDSPEWGSLGRGMNWGAAGATNPADLEFVTLPDGTEWARAGGEYEGFVREGGKLLDDPKYGKLIDAASYRSSQEKQRERNAKEFDIGKLGVMTLGGLGTGLGLASGFGSGQGLLASLGKEGFSLPDFLKGLTGDSSWGANAREGMDFDWDAFLENPDWDALDAADPFGLGSTEGDAFVDLGFDTSDLDKFVTDLGDKMKTAIEVGPDGKLRYSGGASSGLGLSALSKVAGGIRSLLGGSGGSGALKDLFGDGLGGLLGDGIGLAARIAPGMAALNFAKDQTGVDTHPLSSLLGGSGFGPIDTSQFSNLSGQVGALTNPYTSSVLGDYDRRMGQARGDLLGGLERRNVAGSSFGNMDIGNFDTMNEQRRGMLAGELGMQGINAQRGLAQDIAGIQNQDRTYGLNQTNSQANIAAQLMNAQLQQKAIQSALYGRAFDIMGRAVSPSNSLFGKP